MIGNYMMFEINLNKPFRKRAEVYILTNNGKVIVGYNAKKNKYTIPGGKIDSGEAPENAAKREALEEIGIKVDNLKFIGKHRTDYIKIYGGWKNCPYDVTRWSEVGLETYSFVGTCKGEDRSLFNIDGDGRGTKEINIKELIKWFTNRDAEPHWKDRDMHVVNMLRKLQ
jgi:8-oxo-dGTP pyrophosphatase MutT (NUDIX family)